MRSAYPGYLDVRRDDAAQSVTRLLLSAPRPRPWSPREVGAELRDLAGDSDDFPFIPQRDLDAAMAADGADWRWGHSTVRRLGDMVLDVLKRAVWLASLGDENRRAIVAQRARTHELLRQLRRERAALDAYWRAAQLPDRSQELAATPAELARLRAALAELVRGWGVTGPPQDMGARLQKLARGLAQCLLDAGEAMRSICRGGRSAVDREGSEQNRLRPLVELLVPDEATTTDDVLRRMLSLEVLHVAFTGVSDVAEQAVELIQVSSLREELVTGIQLHHFGAFYRDSWRANDWLRGRIDGSEQLVQMLLAPERLRQLGLSGEDAHRLLRAVGVGPAGTALSTELAAAWDAQAPRLTAELAAIEGDGPLPRTFPLTAKLIADRVRTELLPAELASLATVVTEEQDPVAQAVQWAIPARTRLATLEDAGRGPARRNWAACSAAARWSACRRSRRRPSGGRTPSPGRRPMRPRPSPAPSPACRSRGLRSAC